MISVDSDPVDVSGGTGAGGGGGGAGAGGLLAIGRIIRPFCHN